MSVDIKGTYILKTVMKVSSIELFHCTTVLIIVLLFVAFYSNT